MTRSARFSAAALLLTAGALAALLSPATLAAPPPPPAETFQIDPVHSTVLFRIKHLDVSWFYGTFTQVSGRIVHDAANPAASSIEVTVPTDSVFTNNADRDRHVKGPDFFNVQQFPTITFRSTRVEAAGPGRLRVTGDLTLHGVTRPITTDVDVVGARDAGARFGYRAGFETTFTVRRTEFDMGFMAGPTLGDEVRMTISLEGIRQ